MSAIGALHLNTKETNVRDKKNIEKQNICYRDLKPENVMLKEDDSTIKLIDFNTAKLNLDLKTQTVVGIIITMDPAIYNKMLIERL